MTHPDHYQHINGDEHGIYALRFLIAAINDDKNAHNLTCDELDRRIRGCTICAGELHAAQATFTADLLKAVDECCSGLVDATVTTVERTLAGLLDAGQP